MQIDGNLIPILAIAGGIIITVTAILSDHISRYKLKVEQIRADAMVRAEEVRTRNQLELEKLINREQSSGTAGNTASCEPEENLTENRTARNRVRE